LRHEHARPGGERAKLLYNDAVIVLIERRRLKAGTAGTGAAPLALSLSTTVFLLKLACFLSIGLLAGPNPGLPSEAVIMNENRQANAGLTPEQQFLNDLWEEHLRDEFTTHDTDATLDTMVPDAYVNHIPVLTGGVGREQLRQFYSRHFIPKMPPDTEIVPISRTIGRNRLVDEMIFRFTHTLEMDWMLPGVPPTGKPVECGLVVIVHFCEGKLSSEHIYWDQASVLVQLGLLDPRNLPVAGAESAKKLADANLPSNHLIERAKAS